MSERDFTALLKKSASEIQRPWNLPAGTYTFLIIGYEFGESSQKKTPYVRYKVNPTAFDVDVEPADLEGKDWMKKELRTDFYLTEGAMYRLVDFLGICGVNTEGRTLDELVPEAVGRSFKGAVSIRANDKDPAAPGFNDITSFIRAE